MEFSPEAALKHMCVVVVLRRIFTVDLCDVSRCYVTRISSSARNSCFRDSITATCNLVPVADAT